MSKSVRYALLIGFSLMFAAAPSSAGNQVTLKAYEGYSFAKHAVTKNDDAKADVSFNVAKLSDYPAAALGARKIKNLGQYLPDATAFMTVKQWPTSVTAPMPGYYAVQGKDGRSIYLVQVQQVDNYGRNASRWQMSFTWERLD